MFINISGRLMLINASIIIKRRKNKQIRIESMAAFVFISGIHRTNGSDNEQLFGKSHSLFTAPKAKPSQGKAGMRGVACVLLIYNFLRTPINEMFLLSRVLCVFSICI